MKIYIIKNESLRDGKYTIEVHDAYQDRIEAWKKVLSTCQAMFDMFDDCEETHQFVAKDNKIGVKSIDGTFFDCWSVQPIECHGVAMAQLPAERKWSEAKHKHQNTIVLVESLYEDADGNTTRMYETFYQDASHLREILPELHLWSEENIEQIIQAVILSGKKIAIV